LCAVKDVYSGRIAGYAISDRMKARLAVAALDSALARGRGEGHDVSEIVSWIERTYHRRRRQDRLGRLTPIGFETIMTTALDVAA